MGYKSQPAFTCCVYQGHYGHFSGKPTWLYVVGLYRHQLPELRWGKTEQRIHPVALAKHGYEKARRIGMMAMVGGKDKTRIRNATPDEFRDVLIGIARKANGSARIHHPLDTAMLMKRAEQLGMDLL